MINDTTSNVDVATWRSVRSLGWRRWPTCRGQAGDRGPNAHVEADVEIGVGRPEAFERLQARYTRRALKLPHERPAVPRQLLPAGGGRLSRSGHAPRRCGRTRSLMRLPGSLGDATQGVVAPRRRQASPPVSAPREPVRRRAPRADIGPPTGPVGG